MLNRIREVNRKFLKMVDRVELLYFELEKLEDSTEFAPCNFSLQFKNEKSSDNIPYPYTLSNSKSKIQIVNESASRSLLIINEGSPVEQIVINEINTGEISNPCKFSKTVIELSINNYTNKKIYFEMNSDIFVPTKIQLYICKMSDVKILNLLNIGNNISWLSTVQEMESGTSSCGIEMEITTMTKDNEAITEIIISNEEKSTPMAVSDVFLTDSIIDPYF